VPYLSKDKWAPYRFGDDGARAGVITHISFLSVFSHPAVSSPTKRGVALNEIFLCQPTPTPPNNVDFTAFIASSPNKPMTVRARLEEHISSPVCAGCHSLVDPTGVALERFDALGQYREQDDGQVIDVHSQVAGKPFDGAVGLGQLLHDDPRATSCVARTLYATGTGRSVSPGDRDALAQSFAAGGYRLRSFLKWLALGDELYSAPAPARTKVASANGMIPAPAKGERQ
jgi:hypothetical protein